MKNHKNYKNHRLHLMPLKGISFSIILMLAVFTLSFNSFAQLLQDVDKADTNKNKIIAQADEADVDASVAVFPEMTITDETNAGYIAKQSFSSTKTDTPILQIPQSITVITRDELDMRSVQNFTEALRYVPGVNTDAFGFEGRGLEWLSIRGFDATDTANFRDGLSNAGLGLFFGRFITDPYGMERIDVLRGPSSVMFGRGDAGGIVNRITKRPNANPIREIELQYGNFDRKRVAADVGFTNKEKTLMFRLVSLGLDTNTQVRWPNTGGQRAFVKRFYIAPSVTLRPTLNTTITFMGEVLNNRSNSAAFFVAGPNGERTNRLAHDPSFTRYNTNQSSFSYQLEHHFNDTFTVRQNLRQAQQKGVFRDLFALGYNTDSQPTLLDREAFGTNERLSQTVLDTHLQANLSTGPVDHTLLFGVDWNATNATIKDFFGRNDGVVAQSLDLLNPVYGQAILSADFLSSDAKQKIHQLGVYIQDQIKYQDWVVTLSGRYDNVESTFTEFTTNEKERSSDSAFTGRAGITYLFSNGIAPYVSFSQSFLPLAGLDSNNQAFDPTRGTQYEVGVKYQPVGRGSLITAALFDLTKSNVLTPDPINPFRNVQTGKIRSRGAEVEARVDLMDGLSFIGSFTYQEATVIEGTETTEGNSPIRIPTTLTSGWLDYSFANFGINWLRGLGIGGGVRYVGRVFDDEENTSTTPAFTLFDATLRYDYGPVLFTINASNLFNKDYVSTQSFGTFFVGTQRTVVGTLKYRF